MGLLNRKPESASEVDLRDDPAPKFGYPTPCPACAAPGYLDSIDLTRRVMFQHCTTCMTKWETTEAELVSG